MGLSKKAGWTGYKPYIMRYLLIVLVCVLELTTTVSATTESDEFHFTHNLYNATIYEKAPGKTYVLPSRKMGVYVSDSISDVKYRIFDGDKTNIFRAEEYRVGDFYFLRVRTHTSSHGVLNRELQSHYHLKLKAIGQVSTGSSLTATTDLIINVADRNDLNPLFDQEFYNISIPEDTSLHSSIMKVAAFDGDIGINAEIYYSFRQRTNMFAIHPTSGVISLTGQLNYFQQKEYELEISAEDRGPKSPETRSYKDRNAIVRIIVTQTNFFPPEISVQRLPKLAENDPGVTTYAILNIVDQDIGQNGKIGEVKILNGTFSEHFKIQKSNVKGDYDVLVMESLSREMIPSGFNITVEASDIGQPPKTSRKIIYVDIMDTSDNQPLFSQEIFYTSIEEIAPVGTPVIYLQAKDKVVGKNAKIWYEIDSGNDNGLFRINKNTGLISSAGVLNTEIIDSVELVVNTVDRGTRGVMKKEVVKVNISIVDCNDNSPIFNVTDSEIYVDENLPLGSEVYKVEAFDLDKGENSHISFSITNLNSVPFEIDHFSGIIRTTQTLDFESMKRTYKVKISASDWGSPYIRRSEIILNIQVRNINDNTPIFEKNKCSGYLSREAPVGTELVVITAIDFDNNIISYRLESGNEDGCFEIGSTTGTLRLNCSISQTESDKRNLVVIATDGDHDSDPVTVSITLVNNRRNFQLSNSDANIQCESTNATQELARQLQQARQSNEASSHEDMMTEALQGLPLNRYTPLFPMGDGISLNVSEGVAIGTTLVTVKAQDQDQGYNGMLVYVINDGDPFDQFKVNTTDGRLIVIAKLDRELIPKYDIEIVATDLAETGSRKSATTVVSIFVNDENDNTPIFERNSYEVSVSESILINATVKQVLATDQDLGPNGKITYSIEANYDTFAVNPANGFITVKKMLDREVKDLYYLPVKAADNGKVSLASTATVTVSVLDVNDNVPKFIPETYNVKIREDLPIGTVVTTVTADDQDKNENGRVTYKLTYGADDKFEIDETTGVIRVTGKLDFESRQIFNISVHAEDGGEPPLMSACIVNVEIIDVNENLEPPVFRNFVEIGYVKENLPVGAVVMYVSATDPDGVDDGRGLVTYSIRDGSGLGRFSIDSNGTIRTNQVLDRETTSHYWLTVYAQDRGLVPLHARLEVYINVIDVNDNVPQMEQPVYYMQVMENSNEGTVVGQVTATDKDENPSQSLTYEITRPRQKPKHYFQINPLTGVISTTKRKLDRDEGQTEHVIEVTVSDNGIPNLSSSSRVVVKILDENDCRPKFLQRSYRVRVMENPIQGKKVPVIQVLARDNDEGRNSQITYKLKGKKQSAFTINQKTGMIYSKGILVADKRTHELRVRAFDNGMPRLKDTARIRIDVMNRITSSPNPPQLHQDVFKFQVLENRKVGENVGLIEAEDIDSDKIWYSIIDGDPDNHFSIHPEHGIIVVARELDWETQSLYNLTIAVTDGVHQTQVPVIITVLDINDNTPMFTRSSYEEYIAENSALGTTVLQVPAIDRDENSRLFYVISSAVNEVSKSKFKIDLGTGIITVKDELDREVLAQHELTVMVRDQGTQSNRNYTRVIIHVIDNNDHRPEFLSDVIEGRVFETAAIGTSVVQVFAIDQDKGNNAELTYSIESGNVGGMFDIEETMGTISVAKELDRDRQAEYELIVMATDRGTPAQSSTATVKIYVTISNNAPPKFSVKEFVVELTENCVVGTNVATVEAVSQSSITYHIVKGNGDEIFSINPNSGVVYTKEKVDYEVFQFFNLTVVATNIIGMSAMANLVVHVRDQNDNAPSFVKSLHVGNVTETDKPGTVVLTSDGSPLIVHATDLDSNANSFLSYEILDNKSKEYFVIDQDTGAIRTRALLDHEMFDRMEFLVQVSDKGSPLLKSEIPARVIIYINDVNDNPPVFTASVFNAELLLPTSKNVKVLQVSAEDPDTGNGDELTYSIVEGNFEGRYEINPQTGDIYLKSADHMSNSYLLTVQVSDGQFDSTSNVNITIKSSVNSGFVFSKSRYVVHVTENVPGIKTLTVLQVVNGLNHHLTYTLLNEVDMFSVIKSSGVLQTKGRQFDREEQDVFTLVVRVEDKQVSRVANILVDVIVDDENDNTPIFVNQPYDTVIAVNLPQDSVVRQVTAIDRDEGENGHVVFSMIRGYRDKFDIRENSGQIVLKHPLEDSDKNKEISLIVRASDQGEHPNFADVEVKVKIISESHPKFERQFYTASVKEDVQLHSPVTSVVATSPNGHKLIYTIVNGDPYKEFSVDFNIDMDSLGPCVITVVSLLDYESTQGYDLTIRASDVKTGAYAETKVRINVEDVNDKPPVFSHYIYTATVSEAVSVGSFVVNVQANDGDSGMNSKVHYSLAPVQVGSTDTDYFDVNSESGLISTSRLLDHETQKEFVFLAVATDSGIPALSSTVRVHVILQDLNDNPPYFDQPSYNCEITDQATSLIVTKVSASDPDSCSQGNLQYTIIGGNDDQTFHIDSQTGLITLSSRRRGELYHAYTINVSVSDGVFTSFVRVGIAVRSSNSHSPVFQQNPYRAFAMENMGKGMLITTVSALDEDQGNYGMLTYTIPSQLMQNYFSIDADTGELFSNSLFDREERDFYVVQVAATDNGGRMGYTTVEVKVTDINDNIPQFLVQEYRAVVSSEAAINSSVLQVKATDKDLGVSGQVIYQIHQSEASRYFDVEQDTGHIFVKENLLGSVGQTFQFFMRAIDQGDPQLENNAPVEIYVMSSEDRPPVFRPLYNNKFTISENESINTVVKSVTVEGTDEVIYSIVPGQYREMNNPEMFSIDGSGNIRIVGQLDAEKTSLYTLTIQAQTTTSPPLMDHIQVQFAIEDENDNIPEFESNPYVVTVFENSPVGTEIVQVRASDKDSNAKLQYKYGEDVGTLSEKFHLDPFSGWISLVSPIDREEQSEYNLTVIVTDVHAPTLQVNQTVVKIQVTDNNDNPPIFSRSHYQAAINEDAFPGQILLSLETTDADSVSDLPISYYIIAGDPLGKFAVHKTGEIFVIRALDREMVSRYKLTVIATDGGLMSRTSVTIDILDANDNSPVCKQPLHSVVLSEDDRLSTIVTRIKATDADDKSTRNAEIEYRIQGEEAQEKFTIDQSKGILTTKVELDREDIASYRIVVSAVDGGGRSCDTEVYIELSDVNDNRPVFENVPDPFRLSEHAEINTLLLRMTAIDSDLGINRQVRYRLKYDENGTFNIDAETGIITLLKSVDREVKAEYRVIVEAYDQGTPSLTSETTLVIALQDVNDNPPEFVRSSYSATVKESVQAGTHLLNVSATSKDIGLNAIMTYSIVAGNTHGRFDINPDTGVIRVASELDREKTAEYVLTVIAKDRGKAPLSSSAYVTINVTDENDNPPLFGLSSYKVNIREDTEVGATVIQVSASDADSEPNARLTYAIVSGDKLGNFDMDPRDGRIRIRSKLDRETLAQHVLIVQVTDSGIPQLFDQTTVTVNVNDANDCPPRFSQDNYTALVQEDRPIGFSILTFTIVDDDLHPNGEPFSFDIIHGNEGGEFRIDGHGILHTAGKFSRNVKDIYHLTVRVFDNGNPPLSSDMPVLIKVIEEGSSPPRVENLEISINSYMDKFPGGVIGELKAEDDDVYDRLTYKVISPNKHLFDIDKNDGRIVAFKGLDSGQYVVNVSVSDGKNIVYGIVKVDVSSVTSDMIDNAITVQLQSLHPDDFMRNYKRNFQRALKRELNVRSRDIVIINVQPSHYSLNSFSSRRKRDSEPDDLDVLFAVKRSQNSYFRSKPLRKKVVQAISAIEQALNLRVIKVFSDMCHKNTCKAGDCVGVVEFDEDSLIPVIMEDQSFVSAKHYYSYKCVCPDGTEGENCEKYTTSCADSPCPYYKVCQPDAISGYQCVCPAGMTGQHCDQSIGQVDRCTDINCHRGDKPMTFSGNSYAKWTLHDAFTIESRLSLSVRVKTRRPNANIMYAKGRVDYSILEVFNGMIQYRFDCGSGEGVVIIPVKINDGEWHSLMVERQGRRAEIFLDNQYSAIGFAPGINDVLNLDTKDVFFGAEVYVTYTGYHDISRGFDGCMENIKLYHVQLPFEGSNAVALNHEFKEVEFHCKDTNPILEGSNICSGRPCMNGGKCEMTGLNSYFCTCPSRYEGAKCEINKDPCADNPCRNNGQCQNIKDIPNEFMCTCPDNLQGKVCEYGTRCIPNPCSNGGTCVEGPTSSICMCMGGYEGMYCEKKINACESNPCLNGGTCYNTEYSYICNCTEETRGRHCKEVVQPHITSNKAGITQEELFAIVGVASGLILLAFLFVVIQCWRRRKNGNRRGNITTGIADDETDVMLRGLKDGKKLCKVSNFDVRMSVQNIPPSPRPPPVPNRPVSYTPSAHDSLNTLNNFDTVRNYGSAADELENCHNIPYQDFLQTFAPIPRSTASVAPSLPPPPPSNPASDTDSIQKATWEDCPNMLENFEEKVHPEKFSKFPVLRSGYVAQETTSFSSLPMSESEDEPDYHWDASDWAPRPSLPNISEVPITEILESPTSSTHSNDSNVNIIQNNHIDNDLYTDPEMLESEYVGDSEYAENDCDIDYYPSPPDYQQILGIPGTPDDEGYELPPNINVHPDQYLPHYNISQEHGSSDRLPPPYWNNENETGSEFSENEDNESVVHYGFPSSHQGKFSTEGCITDSEYNGDYGRSAASVDNMSVSMGGFTSTNASCSDISGLCEIEDSEINLSDEESADDIDETTPLNMDHLHTQV